jgi:hypothetical protein
VASNIFPDRSDSSAEDRTISLSESDLRAAIHLLGRLTGIYVGASEKEAAVAATKLNLQRKANENLRARRKRSQIFGAPMFGEPAWDMLLILYVLQNGPRLTVSRLTEHSRLPATTALRWLDYLEEHGLIRRESHPTDRRAFFVELSDLGLSKMNLYFSETLTTEP